MNKGSVKWFSNEKGFGFIQGEHGEDIFVHHTGIVANGFRTLEEGQNVVFEAEETEKGLQAVEVVVVD